MIMFLFGSQCYILLAILAIVQSLPIGRMTRISNDSTTANDSPVIMSNMVRMQLLSRLRNSSGLLALWEEASDLAKANVLKTQVRT